MEIKIENVTKKFGDFTALDDISLTIQDGELFFLLGPSGCGKTTLLRCLGGFEKPTSGRILLGGEDVAGKPANQRNTAMVFQGYALFPHMTVFENVAFGLEMKGVPPEEREKRVKAALQSVQIEHLGGRKPNELSGGQQQRVALARTLVVEPGCLLLDEPLANLDAKLRRDMRHEIRRLCKDNKLTGVYVTHDRQEALSMADRVAILKDGKIRQIGTPLEIYRRPADAFIANFIGETNFVPGKVVSVENGLTAVETAFGILKSDTASGWKVGDDVQLSMRPETLSLKNAEEQCVNVLSVTLKQTTYLGEIADHIAVGKDGSELKFYELNPISEMQNGIACELKVRPQDVVVLAPGKEE